MDQYGHGQANMQLHAMIERLAIENPQEYAILVEPLKRGAQVRYREYLRETLLEYTRKGNFIRIYPSKNCDIYD